MRQKEPLTQGCARLAGWRGGVLEMAQEYTPKKRHICRTWEAWKRKRPIVAVPKKAWAVRATWAFWPSNNLVSEPWMASIVKPTMAVVKCTDSVMGLSCTARHDWREG